MSLFPEILLNRLWHSTTPDRYELILGSGAILPEPEIPNNARWFTANGPENYPYVRTLGGVSLFDFTDFNPKKYRKKYVASWHTFVPLNEATGNKIWIEIDRESVKNSLIEGKDLLDKWGREKAYRHNIMPIIEAAHIGPLCMPYFSRVLHFASGSWIRIK